MNNIENIRNLFNNKNQQEEEIKRRIQESVIDNLINDIENSLLNSKTTYIKSIEIGELVLEKLKEIDKVGYLLYASVYKDFKNLNDFQKAINELNI